MRVSKISSVKYNQLKVPQIQINFHESLYHSIALQTLYQKSFKSNSIKSGVRPQSARKVEVLTKTLHLIVTNSKVKL